MGTPAAVSDLAVSGDVRVGRMVHGGRSVASAVMAAVATGT